MSEDEKIIAPDSEVPGIKKEMNGFQRIQGVLFDPSKAFGYLAQKPTWILPVVVLVIIVLISSAIRAPFEMQETIKRIEENPRLSAEQREEIIERIQEQTQKPISKVLRYVIPPVIIFIYVLLLGAIWYFGGNVLLGGDASYKKVLSMFSYSTMVAIPETIVKVPLMVVKKTMRVHTSLAVLMPAGGEESVLFKILAKFDIFVIWQLALVSLGLSIIYNFTVKKAAGLVILFWIVWIIVSVGLSTLLGGRLLMG
jgi:hypothetical protein